MNVNSQIFITSTGALCFLGACSAPFGAADIGMGTIANVQADVVQLLAGRTTVAVAVGQIGKSFWAIAGIVLSPRTVSGPHIVTIAETHRCHTWHQLLWRLALVFAAGQSG